MKLAFRREVTNFKSMGFKGMGGPSPPGSVGPVWRDRQPREAGPLESGVRYLLPWLLICLFLLYAKEQILTRFGYPHTIKVLGLDRLEPWQKLAFFRMDILVDFVALPLLILALLWVFRTGWLRGVLVGGICLGTVFLVFVQLQSHLLIGRMMDFALAREAVEFYLADPDVGGHYTGLIRKAGKLAVVVGSAAAALVWVVRMDRKKKPAWLRLRSWAAWPVLVGLGAVVALSWWPGVPRTRFHTSVLLDSMQILRAPDSMDQIIGVAFDGDPIERYRQFTNAPAQPASGPQSGPLWGQDAGADVVFFVLETMPFACLEQSASREDLPAFEQLRSRAFHGLNHHTTSPSSSRAVFAMLTSWYPTGDVRHFLETFADRVPPGLVSELRQQGYISTVYSSTPASFEEDALTYKAIGFDGKVHPEQLSTENLKVDGSPATWKARLARDEVLLGRMLEDISGWIDEDQRYFATFLPQVSHAPWPESVAGSAPLPTVIQRGRAMLALQDQWLVRLLELLENKGRLENTVIVFTGDHGLRNTAEDPDFVPGLLADKTFHLPLLVYAPGALDAEHPIEHMTSHLDLSPTILALLGIEQKPVLMLGSPVWDPGLADRRTYFVGRHYLGVDGFHQRGRFCMLNLVFGGVRAADRLEFAEADILPEASEESRQCEKGIEELVYFQHRLAQHVAREAPEKAAPGS